MSRDVLDGAPEKLRSPAGCTAVVLAAGRGRRMGAPCKPLVVVAGRALLEHAVHAAGKAGIDRVVVVVDAPDGPVATFCRKRLPSVEVVAAPDFARGNGASAVAGLRHAGGRCLVMMADHLHEPAALEEVLREPAGLVLGIDPRPEHADPADATRVRLREGVPVDIGKHLDPYDVVETGLIACDAQPMVELASTLTGELPFNRLKRAWLEAGRPVRCVDVGGRFWADVDTPADRRRAIRALVDRHGTKPADGPVARGLNRPLSKQISRRLLATRVGPTPVTLATLSVLLIAALLVAAGARNDALLLAGGVLIQLASALDGVDGEIARTSGRSTPFGAVLDAVCDRYGDLAVILAVAVAAGTSAAWPWALAAVVANWQLSFLRREHQRLVGELPSGHIRWQWSRDVRLLVLAVSCVAARPLAGLIACALVGNADALRRLAALLREAHPTRAPGRRPGIDAARPQMARTR